MIKVEKLFNALKPDSVLKVKKKLTALNMLNFDQPVESDCNPQMDVSENILFRFLQINLSEIATKLFKMHSNLQHYPHRTKLNRILLIYVDNFN